MLRSMHTRTLTGRLPVSLRHFVFLAGSAFRGLGHAHATAAGPISQSTHTATSQKADACPEN